MTPGEQGFPATSSLTIEADVGRLVDVRAFIRERVVAAGGDEVTMSDLVQAVDELVCNVIEHGYAGHPGPVDVAFEADDTAFVVRIRDAAPVFDPRSIPEPRFDLSLERRPLGGMGIHLARTLTDGLSPFLSSGGRRPAVESLPCRAAAERRNP